MKRLFFLAVLAMMICASTARLWAQQKTPLMEQIEAALGQFSTLLDEKKYAEALKAANDAVESLPQPVKETYKPYAESCYGSLSWGLTLNKQYAPAAEAAKKALTFSTSGAEWIEGNLAHAYLMSGQTQEAEKIYRKYIGKIFGEGEDAQSWCQIILGDFKIMREAGIDSPAMAKIVQIFEQEKVKARLENKTKNFTFPIPPTAKIFLSRVSPNGEYAFLVTYLVTNSQEKGRIPNYEFLLIDLADGSILFRNKFTNPNRDPFGDELIDKRYFLYLYQDVQFTPDSKHLVTLSSENVLEYSAVTDPDKILRTQKLNFPKNSDPLRVHLKFAFNADTSLIALQIVNLRKPYNIAKSTVDIIDSKGVVHIYDPKQEKILATTSYEYPPLQGYASYWRCPNYNSSLVFSSDSKHLFVPYSRASAKLDEKESGIDPVDYLDLEIARLKTGKGEVLEVTAGKIIMNVVDIAQNNTVFTTPGLVIRKDGWFEDNVQERYEYDRKYLMGANRYDDKRTLTVGKTSILSIPEDSLTAKTFSLHGKKDETLTKYQDSSLFFSFRGFPAKESNFLRYLPGGERALFFIAEEEKLKSNNESMDIEARKERLNREIAEMNKVKKPIIGLGIFNLAQEAATSRTKLLELARLDSKNRQQIEENVKKFDKSVKEDYAKWRKTVKVGKKSSKGLILEIKGEMAKVQIAPNKTQWFKIEDLYGLGYGITDTD